MIFYMNLDIIRRRNKTEGLLLSITKHCETLIKQTLTKSQEAVKFKLTKPEKKISSNHPVQM